MIATIKVIQYNLSLLSYMIYFINFKLIKRYNINYSDITKQPLMVGDFLVNSQTTFEQHDRYIQLNYFIGILLDINSIKEKKCLTV